ncbi:short-chain dehydrogenase/reductase SDR [Kribbella flavida DSM 17836]|uniref:Short-chain dehydrogenase/reductase SDR n=1 Tax=Kribbella flavida (strain DSM 17836 / JCM 10339 / NBRC 14399) TaxID=479435 RepID=D2PT60_KRIFD|nr:SDR family NAD(P)-dependent oxidoreductase [Kribbella flavida]ADB29376.1 short-chain dehydrogenase/reductase SDR [Kribbella flavida DSM 17836]
MPKTLAIVGAGPGLGAGVARAFGRRGYRVALIGRTRATLISLAEKLAADGIQAEAFPADIHHREALRSALREAAAAFGPITVLEYGPSPTGEITTALGTTVESATQQFELHMLGAITAVGEVLPGMLARGDGAVLLTTGVSSTVPAPFLGNVGPAMAALKNWAGALATEVRARGVYVGTLTIATGVVPGSPDGDPDLIGERYYELARRRDHFEQTVGDLGDFRALVAQSSR